MGVKNKSDVDYWISDDGLLLLECWSRDGMKLKDIAFNMGISASKLSQWRNQYEEIDDALKSGKEVVDYRVENALLKSALGFETKEITVQYENCLECGACRMACPKNAIDWNYPKASLGVLYKKS